MTRTLGNCRGWQDYILGLADVKDAEKGEAVVARGRPGRKQNEPFTSGEATNKKIREHLQTKRMQETGARGTAMARRQRMEKRRKKENKNVWNSQPGRARAVAKAGEDPTVANLSFLESVSEFTGPKPSTERN